MRADKQVFPHDLMELTLAKWLCQPLDVTSMVPLVDSMLAEECMPNVSRPKLGSVIHYLHSHSVGENLAPGHTREAGK